MKENYYYRLMFIFTVLIILCVPSNAYCETKLNTITDDLKIKTMSMPKAKIKSIVPDINKKDDGIDEVPVIIINKTEGRINKYKTSDQDDDPHGPSHDGDGTGPEPSRKPAVVDD